MAKRGPKKVKDPYEGLPDEWRSAVQGGSEQEIRAKLAEAALDQQSLLDDMENDQDFQAAKTALKVAGEGYRERRKVNKLKIKFAKRILEGRGRA